MTTTTPLEFDVSAPLPPGTVVLEASAGTGKTHAVAALAVRLLGEGDTTIDRLLMVTFGRNATRELRARVRHHLIEATMTAQPGLTRDRLEAAVAGFDSARLMTIHEFCAAMYDELGILATADPSGEVVTDLRPLAEQVARDLYLSRYAFDERQPPFALHDLKRDGVTTTGALSLADAALQHSLRPIVPAEAEGMIGQRVEFAEQVRVVAAERRRQAGTYTFDDQLIRLRDALADPVTGPAACQRLRDRFDAVLVDEFQDTDPVQWNILQRLFDGHRRLVLIGDPKQAIYTFRGADIAAYVTAVSAAGGRFSLSVNHRSDEALVQGLGELFHGLQLGDAIEVHPVVAKRSGSGVRADDGPVAPVTLRCVDDEVWPGVAHERIRADVVRQVRHMLDHEQLVHDGTWRPVRPGDIAVLVRTNHGAARTADALRSAGVPVALSGADSIYATAAADDWLTLLRALASLRPGELRHALVSAFFDVSLGELAAADDGLLADWTATLRQWDRTLTRSGVAALFAQINAETTFIERVLGRPDGERLMTDFRHVTEVLHEASGHHRPGAAWLADWLHREQRTWADDERTRRLETDAQAVQVKTVHGAKGLQYPIVLLPDLWSSIGDVDEGRELLLHDDTARAVVDVGGRDADGRAARFQRADAEEAEESLRLLYVAFTRARSQVIAWWARTKRTQRSALQRVIYRHRDDSFAAPDRGYPLHRLPGSLSPGDLAWVRQSRGVRVESVQAPLPAAPTASAARPLLRALVFERGIDADWRRTSYSGLTAGVHAEAPLLADEPESAEPVVPTPGASDPSPMRDLPGGTQFGSLVHVLFEQVDPGPDEATLAARLTATAAEWLPRFPLPGVTPGGLAEALLPAFATPLGPLADDRSLADLPIADRVAELTFDLPLAPAARFTLADLAGLLQRHLTPDDPLVGYPALLTDPALADQPLTGFLTGSIDAVLRVGEATDQRYVVVDYKTNRLGGDDLTLGHYAQGPMVAAMCQAHYPLQALLYCVALHRFLAARLAGYDPGRHLGGVLYLFVRGMGGAATGAATGVFAWQPPVALIVELSQILGVAAMTEPALSVVATGLTGEFHALGVLDWPDLHPARHLGLLYRERDERVLLTVALAVRALRAGSVCLDLDRVRAGLTGRDDELVEVPDELWPTLPEWLDALAASPLVALGPAGDPARPLRLIDHKLYLTRYWQQEEQVRVTLQQRATSPSAPPPRQLDEWLAELFPGADVDPDQRRAVAQVATEGVTVLAGGPGTGKTTTIARMLALLVRQGVRRIALAAPTGKAKTRLEEAVREAARDLPSDVAASVEQLGASTLHRLLGARPNARPAFRHNRDNPLPHDVVIIDELSMVSLTMMARLTDALAPHTRLVLVGDPDQLSSVDAGAVLSDLTQAAWLGTTSGGPVVRLRRNYRFTGLLGDLAEAIRAGEAEQVLGLVTAGQPTLTLTSPNHAHDALRARVVTAGRAIHAAAVAGDAAQALRLLDGHRLLCAHRHGPFGATTWARRAEQWLRASGAAIGAEGEWYAGRTVLVTVNQPDWGIYNGDTGVVLTDTGRALVHLGGTTRPLSPELLGPTQSLDALTVHKAQGSQFDAVTLVLPDVESPLLTRELLYTAVTRAREAVHVIATPEALRAAVQRTARRASGLRDRL